MRIAVCDDEEAQRALIVKYLQEWATQRGQSVTAIPFESGEQFWFHWEEDRQFDLLVLDIEMGTLSGMDLARHIRKEDEELPILFITGYETYMAQGYEVSAIQYLLKPMYKDKLFTALDKLRKGKKPEAKLSFQTQDGMLFLPPSQVWYIEASGHYCVLHTCEDCYLLRHSFTDTAKLFKSSQEFVHCHRSYLVNLKHVSSITKTELKLDNKTAIPISRSSYKAVNQAFIRNYGLNRK